MDYEQRNSGFTLIELLIVVALVGILVTIGIPTFRKMVQKARQSEAKISLAAVFTAETSFNATYGQVGNHLTKIGYENSGTIFLYTVGFPDNACADLPISPMVVSPLAQALNNENPSYFAADLTVTVGGTIYQPAGIQTTAGRQFVPGMICRHGAAPSVGPGQFIATATGCVAPGCLGSSPASPGPPFPNQDVWTIDETRLLTNLVDGITP